MVSGWETMVVNVKVSKNIYCLLMKLTKIISEIAKPKILCPDSKTYHLSKEQNRVYASFRRPKTNIDWKHVKAIPRWSKQLHASLLLGKHTFTFVATDPNTKLTEKCSFHIIVEKP